MLSCSKFYEEREKIDRCNSFWLEVAAAAIKQKKNKNICWLKTNNCASFECKTCEVVVPVMVCEFWACTLRERAALAEETLRLLSGLTKITLITLKKKSMRTILLFYYTTSQILNSRIWKY